MVHGEMHVIPAEPELVSAFHLAEVEVSDIGVVTKQEWAAAIGIAHRVPTGHVEIGNSSLESPCVRSRNLQLAGAVCPRYADVRRLRAQPLVGEADNAVHKHGWRESVSSAQRHTLNRGKSCAWLPPVPGAAIGLAKLIRIGDGLFRDAVTAKKLAVFVGIICKLPVGVVTGQRICAGPGIVRKRSSPSGIEHCEVVLSGEDFQVIEGGLRKQVRGNNVAGKWCPARAVGVSRIGVVNDHRTAFITHAREIAISFSGGRNRNQAVDGLTLQGPLPAAEEEQLVVFDGTTHAGPQ